MNDQSRPDSGSEACDTLAESVRRMARIGFCSSPSFSPDGRRIAFISDLSGLPQVWVVDAEGGWPELLTSTDDQIIMVAWSPDGAWLAFSLAPGGGLNQQIYLMRPDGSALRRLTDGGKENNALGPWTDDGRAVAISSNRRSSEAIDAYLVDIETGEWRLVAENRGIGSLSDVSRDGRRAMLYRMVSRGDDNLFLLDLAEHREILLTPHDGPGSFDHGRFSPDGRYVYFVSNEGRDLTAFARVAIEQDGRPGPIQVVAARDDAELDTFEISYDGTTAALVWNVSGRAELAFVDLVTETLTPGPPLPAEIVAGLTFSRDGRRLALVASGSGAPRDIWLYDRASQHLKQVTHSPHPGISLSSLIRPQLVRFPAHDGLELTGWLYLPAERRRPAPGVISFHGGPEGQERPRFDSTYQALLASGIAVFAPNIRGSSGFGKRFVNLDNGPLRVDAVRDIEACVKYLVDHNIADPERIGIMGGSYGGYMVMAGLTEYPDLFAAGANLFGMVNFETFFAHTEPWMAAISKVEYGDPEAQVDLLRRLSPIHKIDRIVAPTIVLHGANDTNVPVIEAEQVVENLRRREVPVEYVLFADEGHGFSKTPNRIRSTVSIVRWFAEHLGVS